MKQQSFLLLSVLLSFVAINAQVVTVAPPPIPPLLSQPTQLPNAVQNLLNAPPNLLATNNPNDPLGLSATDPSQQQKPTQVVVHVVSDTTDERDPNLPPTPPGTAAKPYQAVPLDNAQNLQIFQAAPLLAGQGGAVVTSAATLNSPNYVAPLINRDSTAPGTLGYVAVGTRPGVRIVGEDGCGCLTDSNPCDNPCQQQRTPADEVEEALDRVKSAITQQSNQIQSDHRWIQSVRTIMRHYERKIQAVEEDASRVKQNIGRLFEKKRRYEDMLEKLRKDEEQQSSNPNPHQIGKPGEVYSAVVATCNKPKSQC